MPAALTAAQAALAARGFKLLASGPPEAARAIAQTLANDAPRAPDAVHLLALALTACGDYAQAEQAFRRVLLLLPKQPAILGNFARMLRRAGRLEPSIAVWRELVGATPADASAWLELGLSLLDAARTDEAISALRQSVNCNPRLTRAWQALGNALRATDALAEAEAAIRQGLAVDQERDALWANLGGVLRLRGRADEAVTCYQRAGARSNASPELLDALVGAQLDAGKIDDAFATAEQLTTGFPAFVPGHVTLANLRWEYRARGDAQADPLAPFRAAAAAAPQHHDLQLALIGFLLEAQHFDEALERLRSLRTAVDHPRLLALEANALEQLGQSAQAAQRYAEADRTLGDHDVNFINAYVRHLLRAGRADEAADRAQSALAIAPDHQETWAYLATAWRLCGDAREQWLVGDQRLTAQVEVDVPDGWPDMATFLSELVVALEPLHRAHTEPVRQSLRHGSQTPGRLFGRPDPHIAALERALVRSIDRRIASLPKDPSHPFLRRAQRSVRFTGSWSVKLWTSGRHANHFHSDGWMSSAFYVQLPPSVRDARDDAGCIGFGQPPEELGLRLAPHRIIRPIAGHVALFPSYLWHGTVPFNDALPRITVAFDMLPKT